jgi:hypothetical protein
MIVSPLTLYLCLWVNMSTKPGRLCRQRPALVLGKKVANRCMLIKCCNVVDLFSLNARRK